MNDKQTSALIVAVCVAFLFWLNNTNRLKIIATIINSKATPETVPDMTTGDTAKPLLPYPIKITPLQPSSYDPSLSVSKQLNNTAFGYGINNSGYGA